MAGKKPKFRNLTSSLLLQSGEYTSNVIRNFAILGSLGICNNSLDFLALKFSRLLKAYQNDTKFCHFDT